MESHTERRGRPIAWDPKSPATLLLPTFDAAASTASDAFRIDTFLSHDGVGCNSHESEALVKLLDAQDESLAGNKSEDLKLLRNRSKAYREALCFCLKGWDEDLKNRASDAMEDTDVDVVTAATENLELLKLVYAVSHLSEAFLLLPASESSLEYYETTFFMPGAVTADTVRYLRLHHLPDPFAVADSNAVDEVLESLHPDQMEEDGNIYWSIIESLFIRGCLDDAWALLTRHSMCRRCFDDNFEPRDEYHAAKLAEDQEGFWALKSLLLSAPLPGGRSDVHDAAFLEDIQSSEDGQDDDENDDGLDGVPKSAYRLWEAGCKGEEMGDVPISFNPSAATKMHQTWQKYVTSIPAINKLKRRIPRLERLLSILSGNFENVTFDSWAEALCAELLYKRPSVRPDDMHVRASRAIEQLDRTTEGGFEEVVLSVMRGNAGRVVEVLHELGGGSGAALPALMTSLLCNLLTDAQAMPTPSESYTLQTQLLLNSVFATQSSLATSGQVDLGVRLAVRSLLPHAKPRGDVQITAMISEILEHYTPQTDEDAKSVLSLCRRLVERKSVRILDGCVAVCLCRYRQYLKEQRPGGAMHWVLTGMELESLVLCGKAETGSWQRDLSVGVCFRILVTSCLTVTKSLLTGLLQDEPGVALAFARAKEMASVQEESTMTAFIPEVKVLSYVVGIAKAIVEQTDDQVVAANIVACLEEKPNEEDDGVVSTLARPSMHWELLRLARLILDRDENRTELEKNKPWVSSFDVRGIQVLLERFTVVQARRKCNNFQPLPEEEVSKMSLAFANGLKRAFVAENAKKKEIKVKEPNDHEIAKICAADLDKYSIETQERVVDMMLNF